jgi:hypothetical protein
VPIFQKKVIPSNHIELATGSPSRRGCGPVSRLLTGWKCLGGSSLDDDHGRIVLLPLLSIRLFEPLSISPRKDNEKQHGGRDAGCDAAHHPYDNSHRLGAHLLADYDSQRDNEHQSQPDKDLSQSQARSPLAQVQTVAL